MPTWLPARTTGYNRGSERQTAAGLTGTNEQPHHQNATITCHRGPKYHLGPAGQGVFPASTPRRLELANGSPLGFDENRYVPNPGQLFPGDP